MGLNLSKGEKAIALSAVAVIAVFFAAFTQLNKRSKVDSTFEIDSKINYNMARPDQPYSEYTIEGREIDQYYEGLPESQREKAMAKRKKDLIAKKQAETKKKEEQKKKQQAAAKQKATAKAKQQAQAQLRQQQDEFLKNKLKSSEENKNTRNQNQPVSSPVFVNNNQGANAQAATENQPKPKRTYAEWRAIIFASPTAENLSLFIAAYRKAEVTATELQAMATDLLEQEQNQLKGLGLMVLRSVPSLASLSQLVHAEADLSPELQTYVEQSYIAYFYPQNLSYLNAALATRDRQLVAKVLALLDVNLTRLSQGDQSGFADPRNRRGGDVSGFSMANFVSLIPSLGAISTAQDPELATLAQRVAALIQSSNNIAQTQF